MKSNKIIFPVVPLLLLLVFMLIGCSNGDKQISKNEPSVPKVKTEYTANEVLQEFKNANLPMEGILEYTAETDPNELLGRPNQYIGKIKFSDSRTKEGSTLSGGTIEVFKNQEDLTARKLYVENISKSMPMLSQYIYSHKNILLRIDHQLTPSQAAEYENILNKL